MTRRGFLRSSITMLAASGLSCRPWMTDVPARRASVRFGLVADCHYANAPTAGTRFYRDSLGKLDECVGVVNAEKARFLVELGDLKDQGNPPVETDTLRYLRDIEQRFQRFEGPTYHVLGNHDMDSLSKGQFLENVTNTGIEATRSYYSFDFEGLHFVVLDANHKSDGTDYDHGRFDWRDANVPGPQLQWLQEDLDGGMIPIRIGNGRETIPKRVRDDGRPTIVFVHQLLDGSGDHYVNNAREVRAILEKPGRVLAVFQGHQHNGAYSQINGIHYFTLNALVEGPYPQHNAFTMVEVHPSLDITVTGYRDTPSRELVHA